MGAKDTCSSGAVTFGGVLDEIIEHDVTLIHDGPSKVVVIHTLLYAYAMDRVNVLSKILYPVNGFASTFME